MQFFLCGQQLIIDVGLHTDLQEEAFLALQLCDQADETIETIDHLLVSCVFSRQLWFNIMQFFGLDVLAPQLNELCFEDWWAKASDRVSGQVKKGSTPHHFRRLVTVAPPQPLCFRWRYSQFDYRCLDLQRRSVAVGFGTGSRSVSPSHPCPSCNLAWSCAFWSSFPGPWRVNLLF
jgi:hypothetical protein